MRYLTALLLCLSLSGCTIQQARIGFGAGVIADYATTDLARSRGHTELNPLLTKTPSVGAAILTLLPIIAAEWALSRGDKKTALWIYRIGAAVHGAAAISNTYQIKK